MTARADLPAPAAANPLWTGVWDATVAGGGPLTWLVSGTEVDPLACDPTGAAGPRPRAGERIGVAGAQLVRNGRARSSFRSGRFASRSRASSQPRTIGNFAWWAGDEGVKAKVNLVNAGGLGVAGHGREPEGIPVGAAGGNRGGGPGLAAYVDAKGNTAAGAALRERISRVLTRNQIPYAAAEFPLGVVRVAISRPHHGFPGRALRCRAAEGSGRTSRGASPAGSNEPAGELFPGGPSWALVRSFAALRRNPG